ncbi:MAG: hypothetical protein WBA28_08800 [Microbacteriaceae bacterium]
MNNVNLARIPLTEAQYKELQTLPSATIGDVMDRLGIMHGQIGPVWSGAAMVGPAFTITTAAGDNKIVHAALDAAEPGEAIVINGFGEVNRALIGELIGEKAKVLGLVGFVIDGAIRDVEDLAEIPMPVFARGVSPAGPYKNGPGVFGEAAAVGGVVVNTGDIIVADADGVAVIPRARLEEITQLAREKAELERQKRAQLKSGNIPNQL